MTTTMIVEERSSGHLLVYVRILAQFAIEHGHRVVVATPAHVRSSAEFSLHLAPLEGGVEFIDCSAPLSPKTIRGMARIVGADITVVPHGDEVATRFAFAFLGKPVGSTRLLIMRDPRWEYPSAPKRLLRNAVKLLLLRVASARRGLDVVWLREPSFNPRSGSLFARDPFIGQDNRQRIEEAARALRVELAMAPEVFWFGMTGGITARKNVPLVLEALKTLRESRPGAEIGFVAVGPIEGRSGVTSESIAAQCAEMGVAAVVRDRIIGNDEMNAVVLALDSVVMAYSSHSPNSTLGKAYVLGTRVVAAGPPSVRRFVRALDAGWDSDLEARSIARSMGCALDSPEPQAHPDAISSAEFCRAVIGRLGTIADADRAGKRNRGRA